MYYRRKIILALLQILGGQIDKISLQKMLFLVTRRQVKPHYDFVPYRYGCYSFSVNADLSTMITKGLLSETATHFIKVDTKDFLKELKEDDRKLLMSVKNQYGHLSAHALMKHTYINFPYWAINSIKAAQILDAEQLKNVQNSRTVSDKCILFTIGYEGLSLEEYLNRLIRNDVKLLVDVRNNPLSMKFGFSKKQLKTYCFSVGINYLHFPEVGIQSNQRRELNDQSDYDHLFYNYAKEILPQTLTTQEKIVKLLDENKRIALTCFEANICQCHRKPLAEAISNLPDFNFEVKHI